MNSANREFADEIKSYISINDILQVRPLEEENATTYYSRIDDIVDGKLAIAWPTNGGIRLMARRDQILNFSFMRDGVPCAFTGLIDETILNPMPQITVILTSAVMRVQRRQNYRIKCLIPVEITGSITEGSQDGTAVPLCIRTTTYDISASGLSIRHPEKIPEGTLVEIKIAMPDNRPAIKAPSRVIHSEGFAQSSKFYRTAIHYLAISEADRARIVRYIYRTQLSGLNV
jgi:c-di-GMP-binding flagellar brake protein YcgR